MLIELQQLFALKIVILLHSHQMCLKKFLMDTLKKNQIFEKKLTFWKK